MPQPPAECRVFLVDRPPQSNLTDISVAATDALWIAHKTGLPTLDGSSGWFPTGWKLIDPDADYASAARTWIARSGLNEPVCLYDRAARTWSPFK